MVRLAEGGREGEGEGDAFFVVEAREEDGFYGAGGH